MMAKRGAISAGGMVNIRPFIASLYRRAARARSMPRRYSVLLALVDTTLGKGRIKKPPRTHIPLSSPAKAG